jgi:hypothetical protein
MAGGKLGRGYGARLGKSGEGHRVVAGGDVAVHAEVAAWLRMLEAQAAGLEKSCFMALMAR